MKLAKETALKITLLSALALNMSWDRLDLQKTQLATSEVGSTSTVQAKSGDASISHAPDNVAMKLSMTSYDSSTLICGDTYNLHYQQISRENGTFATEITALRPAKGNTAEATITWTDTLSGTLDKKDSALKTLTSAIKAHREAKKESCAGSEPTQNTAEVVKKREEDKKRLAEGLKNCTMDRSGHALRDSEEKLDCWLDQLNDIGGRIGKQKTEEAERRAAMSELTKIMNGPFKRLLRSALTSDDDSRVEHAEDIARQAVDAIGDAASEFDLETTRNGRSNSAITKMQKQIDSLVKGSQTKRETQNYSERANDLKENVLSARTEYETLKAERDQAYQAAMKNPLDPYAIQRFQEAGFNLSNAEQKLNGTTAQYNTLNSAVRSYLEPQFIRPLKSLQNSGYLTQADYMNFTKPYSTLQGLLRDIQNYSNRNLAIGSSIMTTQPTTFSGAITSSILGADRTIPSNLGATRAGTIRPIPALPSTAPRLTFPAANTVMTVPRF